MLISTSALSRHKLRLLLVSSPMALPTSWYKNFVQEQIWINSILNTSSTLNRWGSHKSLVAISDTMYQPLKGAAGNSSPPQSNNMLETAGKQYQRKSRFSNHLYLDSKWNIRLNHRRIPIIISFLYSGWEKRTSKTYSRGRSNHSGSWPSADKTRGKISHLLPSPFHPSFWHIYKICGELFFL